MALKLAWSRALAALLPLTFLLIVLARASNVWEAAFTACGLEVAKTIVREEKTRCGMTSVYGGAAQCLLVARAAETNRTNVTVLRFVGPNNSAVTKAAASVNEVMRDGNMSPLQWTLQDVSQIDSILLQDVKQGGNYHAYFLTAQQIGDVVPFGIPQDLSALVGEDTVLNWQAFLLFFRASAALYNGRVMSIPTQGYINLLYYRRDLFAAAGLQPPRTWEEAIAAARHFNGTDLNGDGDPNDYGICMWMPRDCYPRGAPLTSILASLVQSQGHGGGLFFHPVTHKPVMQTRAWLRALEVGAALSQNAPAPVDKVTVGSDCAYFQDFSQGRCAMAITGPVQFKKDSVTSTTTRIRGLIGVVPMPGSSVVLDWESDTLVPCDASRCPHASLHTVPPSGATGAASRMNTSNGSSSEGSGSTSETGGVVVPDVSSPRSVWVNVAPFAGIAAFTAFINSKYSAEEQLATYYVLAQAVSLDRSWDLVASPINNCAPTRIQHFDPDNLGKWLAFGYHPDDLSQFLDATYAAFSSANVAVDMRSMGSRNFTKALQLAVDVLATQRGSPDQAAAVSRQTYSRMLNSSDLVAIHRAYLQSINYRAPAEDGDLTVRAQQPQHDGQQAMVTTALASALVGAAALAAMAALLMWLSRRHRHWLQRRLGHITAPGAGPETTLCVTDIQDSTALWERLSAAVMDSALRLHHVCLRRCATACEGYESATEGDSFILAFHSPQHALLFCLRAQEELLLLDWPQELLQEDVCRPVYLHSGPIDAQDSENSLHHHSNSLHHHTFLGFPLLGSRKVHSRPVSLELRPKDLRHAHDCTPGNIIRCSIDVPTTSACGVVASAGSGTFGYPGCAEVPSFMQGVNPKCGQAHARDDSRPATSVSRQCSTPPPPLRCAPSPPLCLPTTSQLKTAPAAAAAADVLMRHDLGLTARALTFSMHGGLAEVDQVGETWQAAEANYDGGAGEAAGVGAVGPSCDGSPTSHSLMTRVSPAAGDEQQQRASGPKSADVCRAMFAPCRRPADPGRSVRQAAVLHKLVTSEGVQLSPPVPCRLTPAPLRPMQPRLPTSRSEVVPATKPSVSPAVGQQCVAAALGICVTVEGLLKSVLSSMDASAAGCTHLLLSSRLEPSYKALMPQLLESRYGAVLHFGIANACAKNSAIAAPQDCELRLGGSGQPSHAPDQRVQGSANSQRSSFNDTTATACTTQTLTEDTRAAPRALIQDRIVDTTKSGGPQPTRNTSDCGAESDAASSAHPGPGTGQLMVLLARGTHETAGGPPQGTNLRRQSDPQGAHTPGRRAVLLFCGLRVRMGCASGVCSESEVSYNSRMARTVYAGRSITAAKAVANAAQGGMVLLGEATQALLTEGLGQGCHHGSAWGSRQRPGRVWRETPLALLLQPPKGGLGSPNNSRESGIAEEQQGEQYGARVGHKGPATATDWSKPQPVVLWYSGCAVLDATLPSTEIYQAATPGQVARWAALPAPTARIVEKPLAYGIHAAPLGRVALAVVVVSSAVNIAALSDCGNHHDVWRDCALQLWHEAARLCQLHGGFLATRRAAVVGLHPEVMAAGGGQGGKGGGGEQLVLTAAFSDPTEAVVWSAGLIARCLRLPWPAALLESEFGEPFSTDSLAPLPLPPLHPCGEAATSGGATQPVHSSMTPSWLGGAFQANLMALRGVEGCSRSYSTPGGRRRPVSIFGKPPCGGTAQRDDLRTSNNGHSSDSNNSSNTGAFVSATYSAMSGGGGSFLRPPGTAASGGAYPASANIPAPTPFTQLLGRQSHSPSPLAHTEAVYGTPSPITYASCRNSFEVTMTAQAEPQNGPGPRSPQVRSLSRDGRGGFAISSREGGQTWRGANLPGGGGSALRGPQDRARLGMLSSKAGFLSPEVDEKSGTGPSQGSGQARSRPAAPLAQRRVLQPPAQYQSEPHLGLQSLVSSWPELQCQGDVVVLQQQQALGREALAVNEQQTPAAGAGAALGTAPDMETRQYQATIFASAERPPTEGIPDSGISSDSSGGTEIEPTVISATLAALDLDLGLGPSRAGDDASIPSGEAVTEIEASSQEPPARAAQVQCCSFGDASPIGDNWRCTLAEPISGLGDNQKADVFRAAWQRTRPAPANPATAWAARAALSRSGRAVSRQTYTPPDTGCEAHREEGAQGTLLPAPSTQGALLTRGPRLRAGVDLGMAAIEVQCSTGSPRYVGPAASGALVLALSAPVSRVQVSRCVAAEVQAGAGVAAILAAEVELADEEAAAAGAAAGTIAFGQSCSALLPANKPCVKGDGRKLQPSSCNGGQVGGLETRGTPEGRAVRDHSSAASLGTPVAQQQQQVQRSLDAANKGGAGAPGRSSLLLHRIVMEQAVDGSPRSQGAKPCCSSPGKRFGWPGVAHH